MNEEGAIQAKFLALKRLENREKNKDKGDGNESHDITKKHGVIYSRVSTMFQVGENKHSLETQVSDMTRYCDNHNIQIIGHYQDAGISGGEMDNRPQLLAMLDALQVGTICICTAVNRLSRNVRQLLTIVERIQEKRAELVLLDIQMDTREPAAKFMLTTMVGLAELEKDTTGKRVSSVLTHLSEEGKLITKPMFGYTRKKNGPLEKVETEQLVIDMIRLLVKNNPNITATRIVKLLSEKNMTNRKNKPFHVSTILSIVRYHNIPLKIKNMYNDPNKTEEIKTEESVINDIVENKIDYHNPFQHYNNSFVIANTQPNPFLQNNQPKQLTQANPFLQYQQMNMNYSVNT